MNFGELLPSEADDDKSLQHLAPRSKIMRYLRAFAKLPFFVCAPHSSQTVAPTIAPTSQKPEYSRRSCLATPLLVEDVLVSSVSFVPFGRVPLITNVLVPFTFPT